METTMDGERSFNLPQTGSVHHNNRSEMNQDVPLTPNPLSKDSQLQNGPKGRKIRSYLLILSSVRNNSLSITFKAIKMIKYLLSFKLSLKLSPN